MTIQCLYDLVGHLLGWPIDADEMDTTVQAPSS